VTGFCLLFGYTKQAYYKHNNCLQLRESKRLQAKAKVLNIRRQMPRIGTRKLCFLLKDDFAKEGIKMGRDKLFTLLRLDGLLITRRRKYTVTTNSRHWMRKYPSLIKEIALHRPEQLWVADITYLDTLDGNGYLHLVTDAYSKQIMGYELCGDMEASSTLKALKMALKQRLYPNLPLIHHSDRGSQYCCKLYIDHLTANKVLVSMTENGDPYENAVAERVNGILKDEFGLDEKMDGLREANLHAAQVIHTYNTLRPHLSCQMLTPKQMHKQNIVAVRTWKKKTPKKNVELELA
jgi:putative transposase